eukprot:GEMP01018733.1.p1 GENE.GEMP01018733.1~~GEMP01018733.1.p1  ORF type:complete len:769 (+),score=152.11 GEMP01018733.1:143-2449(+)
MAPKRSGQASKRAKTKAADAPEVPTEIIVIADDQPLSVAERRRRAWSRIKDLRKLRDEMKTKKREKAQAARLLPFYTSGPAASDAHINISLLLYLLGVDRSAPPFNRMSIQIYKQKCDDVTAAPASHPASSSRALVLHEQPRECAKIDNDSDDNTLSSSDESCVPAVSSTRPLSHRESFNDDERASKRLKVPLASGLSQATSDGLLDELWDSYDAVQPTPLTPHPPKEAVRPSEAELREASLLDQADDADLAIQRCRNEESRQDSIDGGSSPSTASRQVVPKTPASTIAHAAVASDILPSQTGALEGLREVLLVQAGSLAAHSKVTDHNAFVCLLKDAFLHTAIHCQSMIFHGERAFWTFNLTILWCALVNMGCSYVPMDLVAWINGGQLPFFNVTSMISESGCTAIWQVVRTSKNSWCSAVNFDDPSNRAWREPIPNARHLFRPSLIPCVDDIELCAKKIVESGFALRPFDVEGLISRLIQETGLPDVRGNALRVLRLIEMSHGGGDSWKVWKRKLNLHRVAKARNLLLPIFEHYHPYVVAASCIFIVCKLVPEALQKWARYHYRTLRGMRQDEVVDEHGKVNLVHDVALPLVTSGPPTGPARHGLLGISELNSVATPIHGIDVRHDDLVPYKAHLFDHMCDDDKRVVLRGLRRIIGGEIKVGVDDIGVSGAAGGTSSASVPVPASPPPAGALKDTCFLLPDAQHMDAASCYGQKHEQSYLTALTALATLLGINERVIRNCSNSLERFVDAEMFRKNDVAEHHLPLI